MPVNIGPRIGIEGEDQYRKQIMDCVQSTKTLEAQMKALESTSDKEADAQEKAAKKAELLAKKQEEQKKRVEALKKMVEESAKKYGENSRETNKWKEALANAEIEANKLGDEVGQLDKNLQTFSDAAVMAASQELADFFNKAAGAAAEFGKKALGGIIDTTKDFDSAMSQVSALSGATGEEFDTLRNKAREMGATTKYSATESAEALNYMALAGWDTAEMTEGLDGVLNLAAASGMDLAEASDIVTDYLSAFGKDASYAAKMADMMAYAQANSNTTTRQLGEAFGNSAATMNTAGQTMETTTALLEGMANQGNKGAEAGTALSAMMRDLTQKMKDGKIMIGDTAVQVTDASGNFRNMIDILADVDAATEGMGSAQKSAALMTTFTARSVKGVSQLLTEGVGNLQSYETALQGADGAAGDMANTMQDNLEGQLTILKSSVQELAISMGDQLTPYIRKAVEIIQGIIDKFNQLPDGAKKAIAITMAVGTAFAVVAPKVMALVNTFKSLQAASAVLKSFKGAADGASDAVGNLTKGGGGGSVAQWAALGAAAIATLNAALVEASLASNELYQAAKDDIKALSELRTESEAYADKLEDRRAKEEAEAEQIGKLADELVELNGKSKLTTEEQARYQSIVTQLNNLLPDFSGEIDTSTGKLKDQSKASKEAIDELADNKRALTATEDLTEAQNDLSEAVVRQREADEIATRWAETFGTSLEDLKAKTENASVGAGGLAAKLAQISGNASYTALNTIAQAVVDAGQGSTEMAADVAAATDEVNRLSGAAAEATPAVDEAGNAVDILGDEATETATETEAAAVSIEDSYFEILTAAQKDLAGSVSYIDEWATEGGASVEDMVNTMKTNAAAYGDYTKNIQTLTSDMRYGTDRNYTSMVDMLIQQGPKGANAVQQLANEMQTGGSNMINAMLTAYNGVTVQGGNLVNSIGRVQADSRMKLGAMSGEANSALTNYVNTISSYTGKTYSAGSSVADNAYSGMNSRSGEFKGIGSGEVSSLNTGIESKEGATENSAGVIADATAKMQVDSAQSINWGANLVINFAKGMNQAAWRVSDAVDNVVKPINNKLKHSVPKEGVLHTEPEWGGHLVDNFIKGMTSSRSLSALNAAANKVAFAAMPTMTMPSATTTNNSLTYGDIVVNVNGAGVKDEAALAQMVSNEIFRRVQAQKAVWS